MATQIVRITPATPGMNSTATIFSNDAIRTRRCRNGDQRPPGVQRRLWHRKNQAVQAIADKKIECGTIFTSRRSRARSRFFALSARKIR